MRIILVHPEIPQNTGNIARTCAATRCKLILVTPLGFSLSDRYMKRAGLDYWDRVDLEIIDDLDSYLSTCTQFFFFSSKASQYYTDVKYDSDAALIFGSETSGLPDTYWTKYREQFVTIPMVPEQRCINLATSAAVGLYEALRQHQYNQLAL